MTLLALTEKDLAEWTAFELRFDAAFDARAGDSLERQQILVDFGNTITFVREALQEAEGTKTSIWTDLNPTLRERILSVLASTSFTEDDLKLREQRGQLEHAFELGVLGKALFQKWSPARKVFKEYQHRLMDPQTHAKVKMFLNLMRALLLSCVDGVRLWERLTTGEREELLVHLKTWGRAPTYYSSRIGAEEFADDADKALFGIMQAHGITKEELKPKFDDVTPQQNVASLAPARRQRALFSPVLRSTF